MSDVGPLAALANLQRLYLDHTAVSDVAALVGLQKLRVLDLTGTKVSQQDLAELRKKLPKCDIHPH